jgi:hypothetical protein
MIAARTCSHERDRGWGFEMPSTKISLAAASSSLSTTLNKSLHVALRVSFCSHVSIKSFGRRDIYLPPIHYFLLVQDSLEIQV